MKKSIILTCTFLIILLSLLKAQQIKKDLKTNIEKQKTELTEAEAYKMLYDNQVKANDSVLKTIFYALGALGTSILLVIGGNWWFNTRKVEDFAKGIELKISASKDAALSEIKEKIADLSAEKSSEINLMQIKLQDDVTTNINDITLKFTEFASKINDDFNKSNKLINALFEERIKSYSDNLLMQINTISTLTNERSEVVNQKITDIKNDFENAIELFKTDFEKRENNIINKLLATEKSLQASIYRNAGYMWESRKIIPNALMYFAMEGLIHIELKNVGMITLSLDNILELLEKSKNEKITQYVYDKLKDFSSKLGTNEVEKGNKLRELLETKRKRDE